MKPITSLILVVAIVCYVFLPFYILEFKGPVSGLAFTTGMFTGNYGLKGSIVALLPFISTFFGIGFNSMKNRYWGLCVLFLVSSGIYFLHSTASFTGADLQHEPDLIANTDIGEGFKVISKGVGYYCYEVLLWLGLLSTVISMLPFRFNKRLEETIDHSIGNVTHKLNDAVDQELHAAYDTTKRISKQLMHSDNEGLTMNKHSEPSLPKSKPTNEHAAYMPNEEKGHAEKSE